MSFLRLVLLLCAVGLSVPIQSKSVIGQTESTDLAIIRTTEGKRYVGEVIEKSDAETVLYDISLRNLVAIPKDTIRSASEDISQTAAIVTVGFPTYAAWKVTNLIKTGKVQGQIASATERGIIVNIGSSAGVAVGQSVTLLGDSEAIVDPESGEELGVVRAELATLEVSEVINERLSRVVLREEDEGVEIKRGMVVECHRGTKTVAILPLDWKSEDPSLKTGDEALFLTEHLLTELVNSDVPVISRDQVNLTITELADKSGKPATSIPPIAVGRSLKADVIVTGQILAKSTSVGELTLHLSDMEKLGYLGTITGRIRRDKIKEDAEAAEKKATTMGTRFRAILFTSLTSSIGMELRLLPAGDFLMGKHGESRHPVRLTKPFYMGVYEVTQKQYEQVVGMNPSRFNGPDNPVERVSWEDAVEFCRLLSELPEEKDAGRLYRLPTEAEWEYASRAGTTADHQWWNNKSSQRLFGWFADNSGAELIYARDVYLRTEQNYAAFYKTLLDEYKCRTHAVGQKRPTPWGIYDMQGNVEEWCQDWYGEYPLGPSIDPKGLADGTKKVIRGQNWRSIDHNDLFRSYMRDSLIPTARSDSMGFRVVMTNAGG